MSPKLQWQMKAHGTQSNEYWCYLERREQQDRFKTMSRPILQAQAVWASQCQLTSSAQYGELFTEMAMSIDFKMPNGSSVFKH